MAGPVSGEGIEKLLFVIREGPSLMGDGILISIGALLFAYMAYSHSQKATEAVQFLLEKEEPSIKRKEELQLEIMEGLNDLLKNFKSGCFLCRCSGGGGGGRGSGNDDAPTVA